MRWPLVFLAAPFGLLAGADKGGSKKCAGNYAPPVVNLCEAHWPDAKSTRVWMVAFYTKWCGHCRALEPKYQELGKLMKNDKTIGIGAVDCELDRAICSKYGVSGFPTLKAIISGKGKSYNGARETQPIKEWITKVAQNRGTKGGSAKCPVGIFKSKIKDAVVPLCEEHFPDDKAKNEWVVLFYEEKGGAADFKNMANRLSVDLGNDPPDMSKQLKKAKKKRDRITELAAKHGLGVKLPAKGPFGMEALVKVGAVCCDCSEDGAAFCANSLRIGEEEVKPPQAFWVARGERVLLRDAGMTEAEVIGQVLHRLGFLSSADSRGGDEL